MGSGTDGLSFRETAREALDRIAGGPSGAIEAAELVLVAAERYRRDLGTQLEAELAPFLDERGRAEEAYRGAIRRLEERHKRQVRRAERDYVDRVLLGVSALVRDRVAVAVGGGPDVLMNPDLDVEAGDVASAANAMAAAEEARAALAEDLNLNTRLVLEQAFLRLARAS
jgi:hypothetical protein